MISEKALYRQELQSILSRTTIDDRTAWSSRIRQWLLESRAWQEAGSILMFAGLKYEPDLMPLLSMAQDRKISFPAMEGGRIVPRLVRSAEDLVRSAGGIREPLPETGDDLGPDEIDLVLVPGLGFTGEGVRLGRGRGHFDRFLSGLGTKTICCGVCFACQLVARLPTEPHDVLMTRILTENGFSPLAPARERVMDADP